jgi:hypothetical protein
MADSSPTPPRELSDTLVETLAEYPTDQLRTIAQYAETLAEHRDQQARLDEEEAQIDDPPDDLPDEVPPKATLTTKEINDNRYYYWQWREGEQIKSKYKGPANPDE